MPTEEEKLMKQIPITGLRISCPGILVLIATLILPLTSFAEPTTLEEFNSIDRGFKLFTEETFEGNGRSCGTCHIPGRQYNINPEDIKRARGKDRKLIFATNVPGLENPTLVKKLALFNVEGGDALNPEIGEVGHHPVFRGSMTVGPLALTTNGPPVIADGVIQLGFQNPKIGWAGNGSPGAPDESPAPGLQQNPAHPLFQFHHGNVDINADKSIRAFANGAIAQHNPKTLARIAKSSVCDPDINKPDAPCDKPYDFRFATDAELDDMAAFQEWLGRRDEFRIETLKFKNKHAIKGKTLYMSNEASCNVCHADGGSGFRPAAALPVPVANIHQHSGINEEAPRIAAETGVFMPEDPGILITPPPPNDITEPGAFNGQPVIEAARKQTFFHSHAFTGSIEKATEFYFTDNFNNSSIGGALQGLLTGPAQGGDGTGNPHLTTIEDFLAFGGKNAFKEMGAFMRALSAWYSLKDCERLIDESITRIGVGADIINPIKHCAFNLKDTHDVLAKAKVRYLHRGIAKKMLGIKYKLFHAAYGHHYGKNKAKTIRKLEKVKLKINKLRDKIAIIEEPPVIAAADS